MSLSVTYWVQQKPSIVGEPIVRTLIIQNESPNSIGPQRVELKGNNYWKYALAECPALGPAGEVKVILKLQPAGAPILDDIPQTFSIKIGEKVYSLSETIYDFIGEIFQLRPDPRCGSDTFNILFFGIAGATKSSFINSISTLVHPSLTEIIAPAQVGGGSAHVTKQYKRYPIGNHIHLYDTWGLTPKNYNDKELEYMIKGYIPDKFAMGDLKLLDEARKKGEPTKNKRRIHAVLFFLPQGAINDPNLADTRALVKKAWQQVASIGDLNPLLIIAKSDQVVKEIVNDSSKKYPELDAVKMKAANLLNIPEIFIRYNVNYISETRKNFQIDKLTANILLQIIRNAVVQTDKIAREESENNNWEF